jgi:predicted ABC-type transport system involved in lysophospholipase L1 biosynthesis ATPase subunit
MATLLRIDSLWKSYATGVHGCSARIWVLRDLSLNVDEGESVAVVGRRGAGKHTLLHCLLGWRRPDAGVIRAPGLTSGLLRLESALSCRRMHVESDAIVGQHATLVLASHVDDLPMRVDRLLELRDGRLFALAEGAPLARRVAEPSMTSTRGGVPNA